MVAKRPITVRLLNFRADRTLFVNDLTIVPLGSDGVVTHFVGIMREREEALSRREMELERELEERVREATQATATEVARLREECAAKDARIAELLAAAKA